MVRHGRLQLEDSQRRYIGQLDLPLNEEGVRQAQLLQKKLECVQFDAVYCSDLNRSRQTAEIIVGNRGIAITPLRNLREISMGEWEGCTIADIACRFSAQYKNRGEDLVHYRVSGGESFSDCSKRVIAAFQELLKATVGDILIVGHAGVNRLLLCHLLGMPIANLFRIGQDYGCLNIFQCGNFGFHVELVNYK
ncbi:MAG: alpha-ribazole phosphatase [Firmicutes bacterium]|nr:alpha-ribazole phosphatase [Bacillota bacterium]